MPVDLTPIASRDAVYELHERAGLELVLVPIQTRPGGIGQILGASLESESSFGAERLEALLPLSDVEVVRHPAYRFESNVETSLGQRALLHQLALMRALESQESVLPMGRIEGLSAIPANEPEQSLFDNGIRSDAPQRLYIGLLPESSPNISMAYHGAGVALARAGQETEIMRAIGAALGLPEVDCDPSRPADAANPHAGGRIGAQGVDIHSGAVHPATSFEFMSRCEATWIGTAAYAQIFERLMPPEERDPGHPVQQSPELWQIGAGLDIDRNRAFFDALVPNTDQLALEWKPGEEAASQPIEEGFWRLVAKNSSGDPIGFLDVQASDQIDLEGGAVRRKAFALSASKLDAARSLELLDASGTRMTQIAVAAGDAPPVAAIVAGTRPDAKHARLIWEPRNPEGEQGMSVSLWHRSLQRPDQLLFSHLQGRRLAFEPQDLPGGSGVLDAEFAHLGRSLRHREPLSPRLGHRPLARIVGRDTIQLPAFAPILASGEGTDLEAMALDHENLIWSIPGQGIEMRGRFFEHLEGLAAGRYTLILRALDDEQMFDLDQITLIIGDAPAGTGSDKVYLPGLALEGP